MKSRKVISIITSLNLVFQTFLPLTFAIPVYAEDNIATDSAVVEVTPTSEITITPEPTLEPIEEITPSVTPTPSIELTITPTVNPVPTPTQSPSPWTFENVELGKEYIAPQNSGVKLTFTKIPSPAGNLKIEEITLTEEQIKQTGSLSDKAYDITSDMSDGSFTYNLSLPIPESSKGKAVEVKFTEEISNIGTAEKVENTLTKTDTSVSVTSLDHFTIFVVTIVVLQPDYATPGGGGVFSAYVGPPDYGYVSPGATAFYNGREAGIIKAGLNIDSDGHYWDEGLFAFKPTVTINTFATGTVTYDVVNEAGINPVWMTIEIDTGTLDNRSDNTTYQFVPTTNPAGWHTVDAGAGQWQKWNNGAGDVTGNPLISLSNVATAHTGLNVVRAYLRLGMGDSYYNGGTGTIAWVATATFGGETYDFSTTSVTTKDATNITLSDATLNGFNKSTATGHSFWVSLNTFSTASSTIPAGVYSSPDLGSIAANTDFSISLSSITTTGVPTNLPAVTPGTTYYYTAWSSVGGTWYPGEIMTFTTANGPVFIDTNVNDTFDLGELSFNTIQDAITAATTGDTVHVTAGIYTEVSQIVIDKNLSIVGDNKATTIVKTAQDTGSSSDARAWILVNSGVTFNLSKVTLDGTGYKVREAIRQHGNGTIEDCAIQNIKYETYLGTGINIVGTENVNVTNCSFSFIERVGVLVTNTATGTFSGNTYVGKGIGDWLDYAFDIQYGANVTIDSNTISDNRGVALSDGSDSSGISVWDDPGTQATITNNTFTNNHIGVAVAIFSGGIDPAVTIGDGNIFNAGDIGVDLENIGATGNPSVSFGSSTFKGFEGPTTQAIKIADGISVGDEIDIRNVVFKNSSDTVITDSSTIEGLVYHLTDATNRGLLKWDYVAPTVPINGLPNGTSIATNDFDFTWNASSDVSSVTYEYQASLNSTEVGGVLTTGLWKSGVLSSNTIHSSGASNGVWYWQVRAIDNYGNTSAWSTVWNVTKDTVVPTITSVDSDGQTYNISTTSPHKITVTFSEDIANTPTISVNPPTQTQTVNNCGDSDAKSFCFDYSIVTGQEVTHTIYISGAQDTAGNTMIENHGHTFNVDTLAPVITIASYSTSWTNSDITISATTNEGALNTSSNVFSTNGSFDFVATDAAGNVTTQTVAITNIDKTNPTNSGTPTPDVSSPTNSTVINWTWDAASDVVSGVKQYLWQLWNTTIQVLSGTTASTGVSTSSLADETYTMKVTAEDNAGNQSGQVLSSSVTVDAVAPSSSVSSPIYDAGGNFNVSFTASDLAPASGVALTTLWFRRDTGSGFGAWITSGLSLTGSSGTFAFNPSNIDGRYEFYSISTDAAGNIELAPSLADDTTLFDNTNPTGNWVTPLTGSFLQGTIPLEVSAIDTGATVNSGVKQVRFRYEPAGGTFTTISTDTSSLYQGSWNTSSLSEGNYILRAVITDNAGNTKNLDLNVTVDKTAPTITVNNPDTTPAQSKTITASASDGTFSMSNTTGSLCDGTLSFVPYVSQTFTSESDNGEKVCYKAVDAATNTTYLMSNAIAGIDTTGPTTPGQIGWSIENPPVGSDYASGTEFDNYKTCGQSLNYSPMTNLWGPSTDANAGVAGYDREVYSPNSTTLLVGHSLSTNYVNGGGAVDGATYWVRIRAYDTLGNKSDWTSLCAITYDATAPIITIDPYNTNWTNQNITITASTNEGTLNATSHQFTANGSFIFTATDNAGNSSSQTVTISNIDKDAPTGSITSPTSGSVLGGTVTITTNASDIASGVGKVEFLYNDAPPPISIGQDTEAPYSMYWNTVGITNGSHTIYIKVYDNAGNDSGLIGIPVTLDNIAPTGAATILNDYYGPNTYDQLTTINGTANDSESGVDTVILSIMRNSTATPQWFTDCWQGWQWGGCDPLTATYNSASGTWTYGELQSPYLTDGISYQIYPIVTDNAGNSTTGTYDIFTWDDNKPTSHVNTLSTAVNTTSFNIAYTADDTLGPWWSPMQKSGLKNVDLYYRLNSGSWTKYGTFTGSPISFSASIDGTYEFYTIARDNVLNEETAKASAEATTIVDTTAPTYTWNSPAVDSIYADGQSIYVDASITESGSGITDGANCNPAIHFPAGSFSGTVSYSTATGKCTGTITLNDPSYLGDGTHHITLQVADNAGNSAISADQNILIDNTAPTTPTATPVAGDYMSDQSVTLSSTDSGSGLDKIYFTIDNSTPSASSTEYSSAITVDKDMTIKAVAYDKAGNASDILTAAYGIAPIISAETSTTITLDSVTVTWTTDDLATSRVIYDTVSHPTLDETPNYGYTNSTIEADNDPKVTSHAVALTGLIPGTTYYYRAVSHGSPESVGGEKTFMLATVGGSGVSDGQAPVSSAPVCNDTKPGSAPVLLSAVAGTNTVTLTWSAASTPVTYYLVTYGTGAGLQQYGNPNVGGAGTTSYTITGLSGGNTYYFRVRAGNGCMPGDYGNELSATVGGGFIAGPATGFEAGVLGTSTEATPAATPSVTEAIPSILGATEENKNNYWWWLLLLVPLFFGGRLVFKKK